MRSSVSGCLSLMAAAACTCVPRTSQLWPGHVAQMLSVCRRSSCRYPTRLQGICLAGAPVTRNYSHTRLMVPGPACLALSVACPWLQSSTQEAPAFCSLASLTIMLNALAIHPFICHDWAIQANSAHVRHRGHAPGAVRPQNLR